MYEDRATDNEHLALAVRVLTVQALDGGSRSVGELPGCFGQPGRSTGSGVEQAAPRPRQRDPAARPGCEPARGRSGARNEQLPGTTAGWNGFRPNGGDERLLLDPDLQVALAGYTLLRYYWNAWIELSTDGDQMWVVVER